MPSRRGAWARGVVLASTQGKVRLWQPGRTGACQGGARSVAVVCARPRNAIHLLVATTTLPPFLPCHPCSLRLSQAEGGSTGRRCRAAWGLYLVVRWKGVSVATWQNGLD